ncbi:hypothetical protein NDU88_001557 [Pleurodeles waltl]|uniref:Uncharacterized protein n=1 Tax=Pleurodeles waltl TaxID=8319 RepID=A0AAV7UT35_PLEWA|nr:hypothetical protein NDU88_001557 [Pleurodeles waltl]
MTPPVLANPHRYRLVRKAIHKENGWGEATTPPQGPSSFQRGRSSLTVSSSPGPHGPTAAPAPPLMRCPPGPSDIPRPASPRTKPPTPLLPRSPLRAFLRSADSAWWRHVVSLCPPVTQFRVPAPGGNDSTRINVRPAQSRSFTRPPSWPC